jgi:hypothetical protein
MPSHNKTGRSKKDKSRFVALPFSVIDSPGYRATTPTARAALIEALRLYNGKNNGSLALPARLIAEKLNVSKDTASRAIRELVNCGLLRLVKASSYSRKRLAAEYRLTHLPCNVSGDMPSKEYLSHRCVPSAIGK